MSENGEIMDHQITQQQQHYQPFRYLNLKQVIEITNLSSSNIYRRIEAGEFPKQVSLGDKKVAWVDHEIYKWNHDRLAESRAESK